MRFRKIDENMIVHGLNQEEFHTRSDDFSQTNFGYLHQHIKGLMHVYLLSWYQGAEGKIF
jgi:hypothetical protein